MGVLQSYSPGRRPIPVARTPLRNLLGRQTSWWQASGCAPLWRSFRGIGLPLAFLRVLGANRARRYAYRSVGGPIVAGPTRIRGAPRGSHLFHTANHRMPLNKRYHRTMELTTSLRHRVWLVSVIGLLHGGSVHAERGARALTPPSSLKPAERIVAVQVTHRHRAVQECLRLNRTLCVGREVDAESATTVRLEPLGIARVAVDPDQSAVEVTFPSHVGPQTQTARLAAGDWLVDWAGASALARLHVAPGARPQVALVTSSGSCRLRKQRCELDPKRVRRVVVREDASP